MNKIFCRTEEEVKLEEELKRKQAENQAETQFVIDQKRISEIAMCISTIKLSPEEIVESLISIDQYEIDEETLYKLFRMCPSEEERKLLDDNANRI